VVRIWAPLVASRSRCSYHCHEGMDELGWVGLALGRWGSGAGGDGGGFDRSAGSMISVDNGCSQGLGAISMPRRWWQWVTLLLLVWEWGQATLPRLLIPSDWLFSFGRWGNWWCWHFAFGSWNGWLAFRHPKGKGAFGFHCF